MSRWSKVMSSGAARRSFSNLPKAGRLLCFQRRDHVAEHDHHQPPQGLRLIEARIAEGDAARGTDDTISLVYSCTKAATALCAHMLIDRGQIDLHAPVATSGPNSPRTANSRPRSR